MDIFVKKSDTLLLEIYVWKNEKNEIESTHDEVEAKKNQNIENIKFLFRRPSYQDSSKILQKSQLTGTEIGRLNSISLQDGLVRTLLLEIHQNDQITKVNSDIIDSLHPSIVRACFIALMQQINIY